jgi:hypothetical protein
MKAVVDATASFSKRIFGKKTESKVGILNQMWFRTISILIAICLSFTNISSAFADYDYGVERIRSCSSGGSVEGLDFNPTTGGKDIEFVMSNPVCLTIFTLSYATVKAAIAAMNKICVGKYDVRIKPSPLYDSYDILRASVKAVAGDGRCIAAVGTASLLFGVAIAEFGIIYGAANLAYKNTTICGSNWVSPNPREFINNSPNYKGIVETEVKSYIDGCRSGATSAIKKMNCDKLSLDNRNYREWYYGGVEVEDSLSKQDSGLTYSDANVCKNPEEAGNPPQKYYLHGLKAGNFNCDRYYIPYGYSGTVRYQGQSDTNITSEVRQAFSEAYRCCKNRAQNYICLEHSVADSRDPMKTYTNRMFCRAGERCSISQSSDDRIGIFFQARAIDNGRFICAESYSVCPYNFSVGGGSPYCDFYQDGIKRDGRYEIIKPADVASGNCAEKSEIRNSDCTYNEKAGRCRNYCQYMTHCTESDTSNYKYASNITSPFFSTACLNFVGDSRNQLYYGSGFILGNQRHFSAPIAQCVKETLENVFLNRAGHGRCSVDGEFPSSDGECPSGTAYKKGDQVKAKSFFLRIQEALQSLVRIVLTLSITFYGAMTLIAGKPIEKKELMLYIAKVGLVMYFALGNAWQAMFFDGVYSASTVFSQIVFKVQTDDRIEKRDGCQFGDIFLSDGSKANDGESITGYPHGKEWLSVWDTLDCKIARYMGFGPEISVASIAKLALAGLITPKIGPIGLYFSIALMFFAFILIAATLRALHIFLSSAFSIIIMVYVSPIMISMALMKKTEGMFKSWYTNLITFTMQTIILFAYLGIFIMIMDRTLNGSATFYGPVPIKTISCDKYCADKDGKIARDGSEKKPLEKCGLNSNGTMLQGEKIINPKADSFACLIDSNRFSNWPGLELIGIALPFIVDLFTSDLKQKIITIAKAALVLYFLCKFMDEIPGITDALIGKKVAGGDTMGSKAIFGKALGLAKGIQGRGMGLGRKGLKKGLEVASKSKEAIRQAGDKGKSSSSSEASGGSHSVPSGGGGAADESGGAQSPGAADKSSDPSSGAADKKD